MLHVQRSSGCQAWLALSASFKSRMSCRALSVERPLESLGKLKLGQPSTSVPLSLEDLRLLLAHDVAEVCNWVLEHFRGWQRASIYVEFQARVWGYILIITPVPLQHNDFVEFCFKCMQATAFITFNVQP